MEGLISMPLNRSPTVSDLSFSDVTEHLEIMDILTPSVCYLAALRRTPAELEAIKEQVDRFNATRRDELHQRLDAIYKIYAVLGNACHNASLSRLFRLTIYARRRIGRFGAPRHETQRHWEAQMQELRGVLGDLYNSIASGNASAAQLAAKNWMGIVRGRLSSAVSASLLTDSAVQLHG